MTPWAQCTCPESDPSLYLRFAQRVRSDPELEEEEFLEEIERIYPELSMYQGHTHVSPDVPANSSETSCAERLRTLGAMLCVFYVRFLC
jgi:hypothetical protein